MNVSFGLIHSPLVGPRSWSPVAQELERRSFAVAVPALTDIADAGGPWWRQHADAAARGLATLPADQPTVLAGHSGAGPLLPAIGQALGRSVAVYLFVDAGIPRDGWSRLGLMGAEDPAFAAELGAQLAAGERFPTWSDADLRTVIPDPDPRRGLLAELRPRPLAFFTEPIPVPAGWPDAPCGYLRLSPAYAVPAEAARRAGWACREIEAGHFHPMVDPFVVTDALLDLVSSARSPGGTGSWPDRS
jgi:hypothetical protein